MKPLADGFAVVSATTSLERSRACRWSWEARATYRWPVFLVKGVYGVVPAFAQGVAKALASGAQVICCLHDDLLIEEDGWDEKVLDWFRLHPMCGLAGFGGGTGLGSLDIYVAPYSPQQLARQDFCSNMRDAEAHGRRAVKPERVACLDGFSQIGRARFWQGQRHSVVSLGQPQQNLLAHYAAAGVIHHYYDGMLGVDAARLGWETWMLPVRCWHHGGQTAVLDQGYHQWAQAMEAGGDQGFWDVSHRLGYEHGRGILPLRIK